MGRFDASDPEFLVHAGSLAESAARAGGDVALRYFRGAGGRIDFETKRDGSPVSVADREAEARIRRVLADDAGLGGLDILGEEHGATGSGSELRWVVDPIDGTFLFMNRVPQWGTLVALEDVAESRPLVGVVYMPAIHHCYTAARGLGAARDGTPIHADGSVDPDRAILQVPDQVSFEMRGLAEALAELRREYPHTRGFADCFGHAMAAEGAYAAAVDFGLAPWDLAASRVLVEEAGGRVLTRPSTGRGGTDSILGTPAVVERVARILGF